MLCRGDTAAHQHGRHLRILGEQRRPSRRSIALDCPHAPVGLLVECCVKQVEQHRLELGKIGPRRSRPEAAPVEEVQSDMASNSQVGL
eukprot:SM000273S10252  [mRNA]  locus=s273:56051:60548:- [translate_table: standard]